MNRRWILYRMRCVVHRGGVILDCIIRSAGVDKHRGMMRMMKYLISSRTRNFLLLLLLLLLLSVEINSGYFIRRRTVTKWCLKMLKVRREIGRIDRLVDYRVRKLTRTS